MSNIPDDLRYAASHEWVRLEADSVVCIGISDHAQDQLGDLVYVELPDIGRTVAAKEEVAVVESVKAASDIYCPVAGEVVEVNEALIDTPELINSDPYGDGWMFKITADDPNDIDDLLDADEYAEIATAEDD